MLENLGAFLVTHSILWRKGEENANYNLHFLVTLVLFLCRQEKNEKKPIQGGLFKAVPLVYPPPKLIVPAARPRRKCPDFRPTECASNQGLPARRRGFAKGVAERSGFSYKRLPVAAAHLLYARLARSFSRGMIAPGNHCSLDSLRDAPPFA